MTISSRVRLVLFCCSAFSMFALEPSAALFENDDVKVSRALERPHVKGSFHEHKPNRVMVYLQPGRQRFEYQDGRQPAVFDWKAGQVVWSKAEGMHSPEVLSDEGFNIVEVELKKPGAGKPAAGSHDALAVDSKHYKLEFENDQVRVLRLTLGAHETTPSVDQVRRVVVFLTDQDSRVTPIGGATVAATHKAGEAVWEMPGTQKIENTGGKALELVIIEVRD